VKHVNVEEEVWRLGCFSLRRGMLAKVSVRLIDASDELAITHRMDSLDLLERQPVEPLKLGDVAALELADELRVGREQTASDRAAVKGAFEWTCSFKTSHLIRRAEVDVVRRCRLSRAIRSDTAMEVEPLLALAEVAGSADSGQRMPCLLKVEVCGYERTLAARIAASSTRRRVSACRRQRSRRR
jgi:hypothetical protein